jgi:hypothetical protein
MNQKQIKEYIINDIDYRLPKLLEYIGCHRIKKYNKEYRCALPESMNCTKIRIFKDSLNINIFTNGETEHGDIFDLIQHITNINFYDSLLLIHQCFSLKGDVSFKNNDVYNYGFETLKQIRKKNKKTINNTNFINPNILNQYINKTSKILLLEGILKETQSKFNIRLDIINYRILFPHFKWDNKDILMGLVGRTEIINYKELLIPKYLSYYNFTFKSINFYGLCENYINIVKSKKIIIFESEKSVLKLDVFMKHQGIGVALGSHQMSEQHIKILLQIESLEEVIFALDNDIFIDYTIDLVKRLEKLFYCTAVIDTFKILDLKNSPVDKGYGNWLRLYNNRLNTKDLNLLRWCKNEK